MTMAQMEESIQEDLTRLGDPLSQLEYLMACARAHEGIPPEERRDKNLVADCQAKTWVETWWEEGRLRLSADSESFLVRGVLALLCEIYQHRRPEEVVAYSCTLLDRPGVRGRLTDGQYRGLSSVLARLHREGEERT